MIPYINKETGAVKTLDTGLAFRFDGTASPVLYLGEAQPGTAETASAWRIVKIDTSSGISMTWANGNKDFVNKWTDRLTVSYS